MSRRGLALSVAGVAGFFLAAYVVLKLTPDWFAETKNLDAQGRADARQGVRTASLALLAGTIGVIGAVYTARTFALNRAGQITDRFTKAIEQLGHEAIDVRLGGIYALERIARDSADDYPQVVEVLTAYVRDHAPLGDRPRDSPDTDVQAVLTVLGRRSVTHEHEPSLNLGATDLGSADLRRANLSGASLAGARLFMAYLQRADLKDADLFWANLEFASLENADLSGTTLHAADLTAAQNISEANFSGATYDHATTWPEDFDPEAAGAVKANGEGGEIRNSGA